jgi:hypothetical protein
VSVAEVVRVAGGPAARELYAWRGGRGRWRAALTDTLAARLATGGESDAGLMNDDVGQAVRASGDGGAVS